MQAPRRSIEPWEYLAWFWVKTVHGSNLEFVLSAADDRKECGRDYERVFTTYVDALREMIRKEFKKSTISLVETSEYGDVSVLIAANTPEQLQKALVRCERVVDRWINKYRINNMKGIV